MLVLRKQDLNGRAAVYIVWGTARRCLYVGMSSRGFLRPLTNETLRRSWDKIESIAIDWCANSDIARQREKDLIRELQPMLNKAGKYRKLFAVKEPRQFRNEALRAIEESNGDKIAAARLLGISRATLYRRLKESPPENV